MRLFMFEFALLNLLGQTTPDDPEYMPIDEAWRALREEITAGVVPDLGTDLAKWAKWFHGWKVRDRISDGTAWYRLRGPATATGKFVDHGAGKAFALVVLEVVPIPGDPDPDGPMADTLDVDDSPLAPNASIPENAPVVIDTSRCSVPSSFVDDVPAAETCLAAVTAGIQEYVTRYRLVRAVVSVLEVQAHPLDGARNGLTIAATRAMDQAVTTVGKHAI